jgi:hypothetical protein
LLTDDDVQRLAMAVKNLMLDDLRKELRQDMHLCINNATSPLYAEIQQPYYVVQGRQVWS